MRSSSPCVAARPWLGGNWAESEAIDTTRPWLASLQPRLDQALAAMDCGASVAQALAGAATRPSCGAPRFVPQSDLAAGEAYESFIARTASVPTRDTLHDLFNGLVWLTQPAIKRRLNALQAEAIARAGVGATRGALRDALTLFDENGAWLQVPAELAAALRSRNWRTLFVTRRSLWADARLLIVGHALLEKLATAPRKPLTAHVLLDDPLTLSADQWAAKPFCPLPVLGVPGWWHGNDDPAFYDDEAVFRPGPVAPAKAGELQAGRKPSIDR